MMKKAITGIAWFAAVTLLVGFGPGHGFRSGSVRVMTRNLYVGVNVFRIMEANSREEIPAKVTEILAILQNNNPPERLEAIADEIARTRPHLIGLQEVYKIRTQSPGDFLAGNPLPAEDVLYDYLEILLAALSERGLDYRVASSIQDVDVELPALAGFENGEAVLFDARVTDRDVILVRHDVQTANELSQNYTFNASLSIGGVELETLRGFTSVDAWVHGRKYRFVDTHLEIDLEGPALALQSLQALELLGTLASEDDPVIVVGDFNSGPNDPIVDGIVSPYRLFASAGYLDSWAMRKGRPNTGFTCCHNEFLNNPEPTLNRRVDLVWVRNQTDNRCVPAVGPIQAILVGDEVRDRTPSGLWPSDHAGIVARIRMRVPH